MDRFLLTCISVLVMLAVAPAASARPADSEARARRSRWGAVLTALLMVLGAQAFYAVEVGAQVPSVDLAITKTDGVSSVTPGGSTTYTITASNAGPSNASGVTVADTLPAALTGTWTCVGAGGATCTASGSGNISDAVNLPAGGYVTFGILPPSNDLDNPRAL